MVAVVTEVVRTKEWPPFSNVLFDFDKADIRPDERAKIKAVADFLQENPKFEVGLAGYADPRGTDPFNMKLSDRRTKAVVLTDDVAAVERYGKLVEDLGVSQTPSIVIIDRSGHARLLEGFTDADTLTQAVADAR